MSGFAPDLMAGRRYAVVGLGKNGLPAALALRGMGAEIVAWDDNESARAGAEGLALRDLRQGALDFDAIVLSPGIPHILPEPHPIAARAIASGVPVLTDAELLFQAVRLSGSRARFVGITGTNGKSTTTALLAHMLRQAGWRAEAGANLGPAALALPLLPDDGVYVLEMSSYMLERLATIRFDVAAMLNLSPDHIDRHGAMAGYAMAKRHVFDRQTDQDLATIGVDDADSRAMADWLDSRPAAVARVSGGEPLARVSGGEPRPRVSGREPLPRAGNPAGQGGGSNDRGVWCEAGVLGDAAGPILRMADAPALPGAHNAQNAAAAAAMAGFLGLPRAAIAAGLMSYPGLPHRQQLVATRDGVAFVNDSKATNADAAEVALVCYDKLIWIAGGMAKEGGIATLIPHFPRMAHVLLIGRDAPVFAATLAAHGVPFDDLGTLENAVPAAFAAAKRTGAQVVLLSPATASWDQFTGYDQRGDRFAALARGLAGEAS